VLYKDIQGQDFLSCWVLNYRSYDPDAAGSDGTSTACVTEADLHSACPFAQEFPTATVEKCEKLYFGCLSAEVRKPSHHRRIHSPTHYTGRIRLPRYHQLQ
jgi:hypothetical protein